MNQENFVRFHGDFPRFVFVWINKQTENLSWFLICPLVKALLSPPAIVQLYLSCLTSCPWASQTLESRLLLVPSSLGRLGYYSPEAFSGPSSRSLLFSEFSQHRGDTWHSPVHDPPQPCTVSPCHPVQALSWQPHCMHLHDFFCLGGWGGSWCSSGDLTLWASGELWEKLHFWHISGFLNALYVS